MFSNDLIVHKLKNILMEFGKLKISQFKIALMVSAISISGIAFLSTQVPQAQAGFGEPLLGEIMWTGFNFPPRSWAFCDGQILSISSNDALFSLLGTTYGGDGRTTFALPDMRGRTPIHADGEHRLGQRGGVESVVLSAGQIPSHTHDFDINVNGDDFANIGDAAGKYLSKFRRGYQDTTGTIPNDILGGVVVGNTGGSQGHNNMQPFLTISCNIALQGVYPSRS